MYIFTEVYIKGNSGYLTCLSLQGDVVHKNTHSFCTGAQYHAGNIRLVGGSYPWEGRVEIHLSGTWGTITDFYWTSSDAQTVCYTLGYFKPGKSNGITLFSLEIIITNHSGAIPHADAYFGEGSGAIHLDYVHCSGNEYYLTDCEIASNTRQTNHAQDVGVSCQPGENTHIIMYKFVQEHREGSVKNHRN